MSDYDRGVQDAIAKLDEWMLLDAAQRLRGWLWEQQADRREQELRARARKGRR